MATTGQRTDLANRHNQVLTQALEILRLRREYEGISYCESPALVERYGEIRYPMLRRTERLDYLFSHALPNDSFTVAMTTPTGSELAKRFGEYQGSRPVVWFDLDLLWKFDPAVWKELSNKRVLLVHSDVVAERKLLITSRQYVADYCREFGRQLDLVIL